MPRNRSEKASEVLRAPVVKAYLKAWVDIRISSDAPWGPDTAGALVGKGARRAAAWLLLSEPQKVVVRQLGRDERMRWAHA